MNYSEQYKQTLSELRRQERIRIIKNTILNLIFYTLGIYILWNMLYIINSGVGI
jgi:hypothetical protein